MGTKRRLRIGIWTGAVAVAIAMTAGAALADVTTERPGSILILPKVVADGARDTVVQITNTSNSLVHAHCFYVNGEPTNPLLPPSASNPPLWQETDFDIWLTRQQPTHWSVAAGRPLDPTDPIGSANAGIDPGTVPPTVSGFTGELVCVQVDDSGFPTGGNSLKGEATLLGPSGDVSKYNGVAILGINVDSNNILSLDGAEYNACPASLAFPHIAEGAQDPAFGPTSSVTNRLTLVSCSQNFAGGVPPTVSVAIRSCDELEDCLSGNFSFQCWFDAFLSDTLQIPNNPFGNAAAFGPFKYSVLTPGNYCVGGPMDGQPCQPNQGCGANGSCSGVPGLLGVLETTHRDGSGGSARAAQNLHTSGSAPGAAITLIEQ